MSKVSRIAPFLALTTALLSGFSNFLSKIAVTVVKDPTTFTFLKNALVGAALLGILLVTTKIREIHHLSKSDAWKLIAIAVVGGSIPFVLYFTALSMTTAATANFIHNTLFIWVALLAVPLLKERIGWLQGAALLFLVGATLLLGGFSGMHIGRGELLALIATILWAIENVIAKNVLRRVSSTLVAGARMILGSVLLLGVVLIEGKVHLLTGLTTTQWWWTILPSILLLGYVLTWYAALKELPVTTTAALLVPASIITTLLAAIFLKKTLGTPDIASAGLMALAIMFLIRSRQKQLTQSLIHAGADHPNT